MTNTDTNKGLIRLQNSKRKNRPSEKLNKQADKESQIGWELVLLLIPVFPIFDE